MPTRLFLFGLLAWLLLPTAVIGGFYAYASASNAAPKAGPLTCGLDTSATFTGTPLSFGITLDARERQTGTAPPRPIDLVLAVDVSGSIGEALPALTQAVGTAAHSLAGVADVRFAMVAFDTNAHPMLPWSGDPSLLEKSLAGLRAGGGTDIGPVFPVIERLRVQGRPGARTALILFTDGIFDVSEATERAAAALRTNSGDIYVVGLPQVPLPETMNLLTGQPGNLFNTASLGDLSRQFQQLRDRIVEGVGFNARLEHALDQRHFAIPELPAGWQSSGGALSAFIGTITPQRQSHAHPVVPQTVGLWQVGQRPALLSFVNPAGQNEELACTPRPLLLVLSGWLLALAYAPAGVWTGMYALMRPRRRDAPPPQGRVEVPALPGPIPLPLPVPLRHQPVPAVPTLVIGLGGAGAGAMERMMEQVVRRTGAGPDGAHSWLLLDLDSQAAAVGRAAAAARLPAPLASLESVITAGAVPKHLGWFPAHRFRDASHHQLSMTRGSGGDRLLARLALFRWAADGDLLDHLRASLTALARMPAPDGVRQVILVAGDTGGFGSASLVDVARLLRRLAPEAAGAAPDMLGMIVHDAAVHEPGRLANREALRRELETAQLGGALGGPATLYAGRGDPVLDGPDDVAPFNWIFEVRGRNAADAMARSGHLVAVLTDRRPRWDLLATLATQDCRAAMPTSVTAVQVRADLLRAWLGAELFLRVVVSDGLADLEPAPGGGFRPLAPPAGEIARLFLDWASTAEGPSAWRNLLARAAGASPPARAGGEEAGSGPQEPADRVDWMRRALVASVTRRLAGRNDGDGWRRELPAAAAAGVLRRLAERLEALPDEDDGEVRAALAADADQLAGHLDHWLTTLAGAADDAVARRSRALARLTEPPAAGETLLDGAEAANEDLVRAAFEAWLPGRRDVVSALRERLHFAAVRDRSGVALTMRCYVGTPRDYTDPVVAAAELGRLLTDATALSGGQLEGRLIDKLAAEGPMLAGRLVQDDRPPWVSMLVLSASGGDAPPDGFPQMVRDPAGHGLRRNVVGDDRSAVRRVAISAPQESVSDIGPLPLISAAEVAAEQLRERLHQRFGRFVPVLPAALRLALADGEGFAAFTAAYRRGAVLKTSDSAGRPQWATGGVPLTRGTRSGLDEAALAFVRHRPPVPGDAPDAAADFAAFEAWQAGQPAPWDDAAVQAVVALFLEDSP